MSADKKQAIAVFGPGLMGGSLLMALRQRSPATELRVWARRDEALAEVRARGLADVCSTEASPLAAGCDVVVLCLPVDKMGAMARKIAGALGPDTLVTDVGSVKRPVVAGLEQAFSKNRNFVGSHPMCGSEEAGLSAARADLYEGATCVVTPTPDSRPDLVAKAVALWESVGAKVVKMDTGRHDRAAALVSHVPHIAAAALVNLVGAEAPDVSQLCAGGFRDTTRVASGSPDLWVSILSSNRAEAARGLGELADVIGAAKRALEEGRMEDVRGMLARAADHRKAIVSGKQ